MRAVLREENAGPLNIMEFGTLEAILGGVAAGLGISLLTRSAAQDWEAAGKVRTYRVPERFRHSVVSFAFRRDLYRTSAFNQFIAQVRPAPRTRQQQAAF